MNRALKRWADPWRQRLGRLSDPGVALSDRPHNGERAMVGIEHYSYISEPRQLQNPGSAGPKSHASARQLDSAWRLP
jgi:hypothetical protein